MPTLINGLGTIKSFTSQTKNSTKPISESSSLAPPVLNIPYEATNEAKVDIQGYATSNSKVKIYLDEKLVSTVTAGDGGNFTASNIELFPGTNNIYGKTEDQKGLDSLPSKTIKLIYDNEKPKLEVLGPSDGQVFHDKKINITGVTEQAAVLYINDARVIVKDDGSFNHELSLNEGENNLSIKAHDLAGNIMEITRKAIYQP